ncbi:MAG: hypothetical protein QXO71_08400 [Candidatus Jordarchaeaceae archaeon]
MSVVIKNYPYPISNQLVVGCRKILKACQVKDGSKVLLLTATNYYQQHIVNSYYQAALDLGAKSILITTEPFQIPGVFGKDVIKVPEPIEAAIWASDFVLFLGINIFYTPVLERIKERKKPAFFAYNSEFSTEWLITRYPPPCEPVVIRGEAGVDLLKNTSEVRYTTPAGTDLVMGIKRGGETKEIGFLQPDKGHTWDILAGAGIYAFLEPGSSNGKLVIAPGDYPSQIVDREHGFPYTGDKITITVKNGKITKIEGSVGAKLLDQWFRSWEAESSYEMCHMGIGTDPRQRRDFERYPFYGVSGWDGEWIEGLINLGIGYEPSHLDIMLRHGTVWFDKDKVLEDEKFVGPLSDEVLGIKSKQSRKC